MVYGASLGTRYVREGGQMEKDGGLAGTGCVTGWCVCSEGESVRL